MWKPALLPDGTFDVDALRVDAATCKAIAAVPQGSAEWLAHRWGRLTASNFGAAAGHHKPGAKQQLLRAMLWPETHAALSGVAASFAAYGTRNEPVARDLYRAHRCHDTDAGRDGFVDLWETGLAVSPEFGWLGCSPDFVVRERAGTAPVAARRLLVTKAPPAVVVDCSPRDDDVVGCGEIKCPATRVLYSSSDAHDATGGIPHYYFDQIQGVMALNHWPWCDMVVYTPEIAEVTRVPADAEYWSQVLLPALTKFYFEDFVPRLNARLAGRLKRGDVDECLALPAMVDLFGDAGDADDTPPSPQ